ncbi:chromosomal replication initiator protein DnaA [Bifidobacterium tsurumiense]|uniref:chromosomal replication initiator protein DnaA n=1 Tax=Bifidobacterium tsurumiense TaxID=356829 RepID=UPI0012B43910|nr:chromosomal replication initiator protein DnaA [Bifidobacterium tsurumiense]MSS12687.1 chromosomal replication initiator protein DnaA [Bifidobacterium tsurumiense]
MASEPNDPGTQAALVWADTLRILRSNNSLTARDKGWFEGVSPEAIFGTTIVLCVTNPSAQQALQGQLSSFLAAALKMTTGQDMFPAFKIIPPAEPMVSDETVSQQSPVTDTRIDTNSNPNDLQTGSDFNAFDSAPTSMPQNRDERAGSGSAERPISSAYAQELPEIQSNQIQSNRTSGYQSAPENSAYQPYPNQNVNSVNSAEQYHDSYSDYPYSDNSYPSATHETQPGSQRNAAPNSSGSADQQFSANTYKAALDPKTHLNTNATFDTFVPGDSNRFARTVALAVAEGSGRDFNPLCIYGGSGLGKTHLLNAIGNYALVRDHNLKVRYVTSEEFTNEFIEALQTPNKSQGLIADFNRRYREVDVLLIDDIQFLGGKESTLEQFFHTFNALYQANKRIVIASDVAPKNLKGFEARLISRFESGLTVDVKPPDLETRIAILRMMASMNHSNIPNDVLDLIAERFTENIRELEGALNRVTAIASLSNQPVSRAQAEQTLQDFFSTDVEIKPTDIIGQVAKYFHLTFDDLVGRSRTKNVAMARQVSMYLAREMTSMSLVDIGEVFGGRDHTTVMHAYTRISNEMQEKQEIYNYVMELTVQLKQNPRRQD